MSLKQRNFTKYKMYKFVIKFFIEKATHFSFCNFTVLLQCRTLM